MIDMLQGEEQYWGKNERQLKPAALRGKRQDGVRAGFGARVQSSMMGLIFIRRENGFTQN